MNAVPSRGPFSLDRPLARRPGAVVSVASLEELDAIHRDDVSMSLLSRGAGLVDVCSEAAWLHRLPRFDAVVSRVAEIESVRCAPTTLAGEWFRSDVAALFARFLALAGTDRARVVMGSVADDSCRYFHVDHVALRLVTTYSGPGTEWVAPDDVDVGALDHALSCDCHEPPRVVRDGHSIRRASTGDVLLMKGELYGAHVRGQVHRSPPIEGTGLRRYVMALSWPPRLA